MRKWEHRLKSAGKRRGHAKEDGQGILEANSEVIHGQHLFKF